MASNIRNSATFEAINPLHFGNGQEMMEVSINDSNTDTINSNNSSSNSGGNNSRPATLPITSPFGPPRGTLASARGNDVITSSTSPNTNDSNIEQSLNNSTVIDAFKEWSLSTFKCTKQFVNEKLGKCQRTVDVHLENEIEKLRDTQRKYNQILKLSRDMLTMYSTLIQQQTLLYESLNELALKETKSALFSPIEKDNSQPASNVSSPISSVGGGGNNGTGNLSNSSSNNNLTLSLNADFRQNSDMLRQVAKNGEKLVLALKFFCNNLATLISKTIEDTIITIRHYEQARLEYDAEKNAMSNLLPAQAASANSAERLIVLRAKYEKLRDDVTVKMKFLDENKAKVMHKQLVLFHNAFTAYASGNASALESTLKQFSIKASPPSWLEK